MASNSGPPPNVNIHWHQEPYIPNYDNNQGSMTRPPNNPPELDRNGIVRGRCFEPRCECGHYTTKVGLQCDYCGHYPTVHENLSKASPNNPGSGAPSQKVIRFYERNADYYEFTNFQENYPITADGVEWATSEHLFQAQKFRAFPHIQEKIRKARSPRDAFNIARENSMHQTPNWTEVNIEIMYEIVKLKFQQHPKLREILLNTGDARLVEHTANDAFWGDGGDGRGRNELGKCLMRVRKDLGGC